MPNTTIKKGSILISRPSLSLDIFNRSVILIVEHSDEGTVGFIINKSTELPLSILVSNINSSEVVKLGGPVDKDNIYYLHRRPDLIENSFKITNGIYWSGNFEDVKRCIREELFDENDIKFFLGYTGWSKNQLKNEIEQLKEWKLLNDFTVDLFSDIKNDLWKNIMKKLGGENLIWFNTPSDPSMN